MNTPSDKDKIIADQEELIRNLQKQIKEWEDWKATSKERHAKGKAKADLAMAKNKKRYALRPPVSVKNNPPWAKRGLS